MYNSRNKNQLVNIQISDDDIYEAMKDIPGYLDITTKDFKEVYQFACQHAFHRIASSIRASDIMTKQVFFVKPDTPLKEVAEVMEKHGISGLPVVDENKKVIGIITEKNFMTVIAHCLQNEGRLVIPISSQKAADIMTTPAITVIEDTTVLKSNNILHEKHIDRVPVVNQMGFLQGIVTRADILKISPNKEKD